MTLQFVCERLSVTCASMVVCSACCRHLGRDVRLDAGALRAVLGA